jgi:hypothetical protein
LVVLPVQTDKAMYINQVYSITSKIIEACQKLSTLNPATLQNLTRHKVQLDTVNACLMIAASASVEIPAINKTTTPYEDQINLMSSRGVKDIFATFQVNEHATPIDKLEALNDYCHRPEVIATLKKTGGSSFALFGGAKKDSLTRDVTKLLDQYSDYLKNIDKAQSKLP